MRKQRTPTVQKRFDLPKPMADEIEILLYNPSIRRAKYGAFRALIIELLSLWLEGQRTGRQLILAPSTQHPAPSTEKQESQA